MSFIDTMDADEVHDFDSLFRYAQQRYGIVAHFKVKNQFRTQLNEFLADNPHVGIGIVVKAIDWGKDTHRHINHPMGVLTLVTLARAAGALPELDPRFAAEEQIEEEINDALAVETDDGWRDRLICSSGAARINALNEWKEERAVA